MQIKCRDLDSTLDQNFISNLVLQRTGAFLRLGGAAALEEWFQEGSSQSIISFFKKSKLLDCYLAQVEDEVESEFKALINVVPSGALKHIVSIGPGNGLIESKILSLGETERLLLIDIEQTDSHYHGYALTGSGYANLSATKEFLLANGSYGTEIFLCNPFKDELPLFSLTLCVSFLSMGFHYPCDQYAEFINKNSIHGAVIVLDKRRNQRDMGYELILEGRSLFNKISSVKSERVFISDGRF